VSETVEWNGQTLYAPVLACRPVRPEDYDPKRMAVYNRVQAGAGVQLSIYPGSVYQPCQDCAIQIAVGPRQQEAVELATSVGLDSHVVCMLCAPARAEGAAVGHLGNPFKKEGVRPRE